ncbi:hypothetical protein G5B30_12565 [Sphingobacterium sp. SGG-5]|nr:hypothetical protein [Sphingobacterium sp. SGG-5]
MTFIIQTNYLQPNGFVMLAPRKSELYSTPPNVADNQEWLPNLALHESRHVVQFDNLTGNLRGSFLQQLALALFGLNLPAWYFEGDAVLQETLHSEGGRGRLASWDMPVRANIQSAKNYDFNKYVHGSFKDIVPSYYTIGYFMNSELYEIDTLIQSKILQDMRSKLLRPFNFQKALKKYSGMKGNQLFKTTISRLTEEWNTPLTNSAISSPVLTNDRYPTDYNLPQVVGNTLYALREGRQKTPAIVAFDLGHHKKAKRVIKIGRQIAPHFHVRGHFIVWDELRKDPRFQKQTYNVIYLYDTQTRNIRVLTSKTRYYSPVLSPDLKTIACVEVDQANRCNLILLDAITGNINKHIPLPAGTLIQQPQYHDEGQKMVAVSVTEQGTNLVEIDLVRGSLTELFEWSNIQYERPVYHQNNILYKANYNKKDDIYQIHEGIITQLTNAPFGGFNPFVQDDTIWYNNYTTEGYKISRQPSDSIAHTTTPPRSIKTLYANQNNVDPELPDSTVRTYAIKNYNVTAHSFNFHSLTLSGSDFENFDNLKPGIFWLSNDVLNTTQVKLGYEYDTDIRKSIYSAEITYQRYYPKITLAYRNRGQIDQAKGRDGTMYPYDWREHYLDANIQLPFSVYRRNYTYSYGFNFGTSYMQRYNVSMAVTNFPMTRKFPLNYQVYLNRNHTMSTMDLTPRWGQNFSFTYRHMPFDPAQTGTTWSLRTNFYFPGLLLNHGLQIRYSYQEKSGRFLHNNDIPLPRGFSFYPTVFLKNTLLMDYRLPLAYPDWSIGSLAYIKRIKGDLSADYQNIETADWAPKTYSAGLSLDFNLFKYPLPVFSAGGHLTYVNDPRATQKLIPTFSFTYAY